MSHFIVKFGAVPDPSSRSRMIGTLPRHTAGEGVCFSRGWYYGEASPQGDSRGLLLLDGKLSHDEVAALFSGSPEQFPSESGSIFAACVLDPTSGIFSVWRDAFGSRTIFYSLVEDGLLVSTFLPAILASSGVSRSPDDGVLESISLFGCSIFPGRTPFKGVRSIPGGHCLTNRSGTWQCLPWGELLPFIHEVDDSLDEVELDEIVDSGLRNSFSRWWSLCEGGGLAFSGGLDSSTILALTLLEGKELSLFTQGPLQTAGASCTDDLMGAMGIAQELGMPLNACPISQKKLGQALVDYVWHTGLPLGGGLFDFFGGAAFHALCADISETSGSVWCGEGADELFMGYHPTHVDVSTTLCALRTRLADASEELCERAFEFGLFDTEEKARLGFRHILLKYGMAEYHLPSIRQSSSAFGLEVASPFLSRELWSVLPRLSPSYFLDLEIVPPMTKRPLRRFLSRYASGAAMERASVRRKRAMAFSAQFAGRGLMRELSCGSPESLCQNLGQLFFRLHIYPGHTLRPEADIRELLS